MPEGDIADSFSYLYALEMKMWYNMEKVIKGAAQWGIILAIMVLLAACNKTETVYPEGDRTVLFYLAGDNNLSGDGYNNINSLLRGMKGVAGRVVIYFDPAGSAPCLMTIKGSDSPVLDTVALYEEENSADPAVLQRVIGEMKLRYPSDSYGLILWSHGTGWFPEGYSSPGSTSYRRANQPYIPTKWFGQDATLAEGRGDSYMEIADLAAALTGHFDFIMFDACFMASVEVLYELRDKADYFVASPAEIISDGFPYEAAAPYFWGGEEDLKQVCREYYNYYANHPKSELHRSGMLSLVKASELGALAQAAHQAVGSVGESGVGSVWRYPLSRLDLPDVFYDLGDYVNVMGGDGKAAFEEQLARTVVYKVTTPKMFGEEIPSDRYSGLSCYIPQSRWQDMNDFYSTLEWAQTVYGY